MTEQLYELVRQALPPGWTLHEATPGIWDRRLTSSLLPHRHYLNVGWRDGTLHVMYGAHGHLAEQHRQLDPADPDFDAQLAAALAAAFDFFSTCWIARGEASR